MPARLKISLSELEFQKLRELSQNPQVPERTRKRAEVLCLSAVMVDSSSNSRVDELGCQYSQKKPSDVDTNWS